MAQKTVERMKVVIQPVRPPPSQLCIIRAISALLFELDAACDAGDRREVAVIKETIRELEAWLA